MNPVNRRALPPDYLLMIITFMLVAVGIFMVFDSSYARAGEAAWLGHDSFFYLKRQAIAGAIGLVLMHWVSRISYWKLRRVAFLALPVSFILLCLVWAPGVSVVFAGAHRWIRIPVFGTLQCSEVAKLGLILFLAHVGAKYRFQIRNWGGLLPRLFIICVMAALVVKEPDMGTALVMVGVGVTMLMACGARVAHLGLIFGALVVAGVGEILAEPYRMGRVIAFADPWKHYDGSGYQIVHSLVALGSGGFLGKGLAQGVQKFFYLPAGHTDFIFATIGEELGLLGTLFVLGLFFMFVYRGLAIAHKTQDPFGMLLAVGLSTMVGLQALLNIAVVTSSVPATGVPLPFISFGGSSLILMLVSVGVLVNISKYPDAGEPGEGEKSRDESGVFGGGTGGHIYPALSTAEALKPHADALWFIGSENGPEGEIVRNAGYEFASIPAAPLKRTPVGLAKAVVSAEMGVLKSLGILRQFRPDVVVVTGGYAGLAAGVAASILRIPLVLEEPNAVPGRTTKLLIPFARLVATAIVAPESRFPAKKSVNTGYPIRPEVTQGSIEAARERWKLVPDRPTVLISGGSQGARTINQAVKEALPQWMDAGFQAIHSAGRKLYEDALPGTEEWQARGYRPVPYIEGMGDAYAVADLVVCRGGATSICEAAACGKPMIVIPYPHHSDRHQYANAGVMEAAGAGLMVENNEAVSRLPGLVLCLMEDPDRRSQMAEASRTLGKPHAAETVAGEILKLLKR